MVQCQELRGPNDLLLIKLEQLLLKSFTSNRNDIWCTLSIILEVAVVSPKPE